MVHRPATTDALAGLLRTEPGPWHVAGQSAGRPPPGADRLDLTLLNQVRQINASDLDIEVEAGISLDELSEALATQGLALNEAPILLPGGIGGHVARGGLGVLGARSLQRRLLGLELVTWSGVILRPGGRTVKNVTGYDLCRPACGAWSRLGVITAAVLSIEPAPPARFAASKPATEPVSGLAEALDAGADHGLAIREHETWTIHSWIQGREGTVGRRAGELTQAGFVEAPWEWIDLRQAFTLGIGLADLAASLLYDRQGGLASPGNDLPPAGEHEQATIEALTGLGR